METSVVRLTCVCLVDVRDFTRLGYGPAGSANIRAQAFFSSLDWGRVKRGEYTPSFVPKAGARRLPPGMTRIVCSDGA